MDHSGYCIHNKEHGSRYDYILVIDVTPTGDKEREEIELRELGQDPDGETIESNVYKDTEGNSCWVCDRCSHDPDYVVNNLFKLLRKFEGEFIA